MKCAYCGKEINDGSTFCRFCGMKIEPVIFQDRPKDQSQVKHPATDVFTDTEEIAVNQPAGECENIAYSKTDSHNPQENNPSKKIPLSKREKILVGIFSTITICLSIVIIFLTFEINSFNQKNKIDETNAVNTEGVKSQGIENNPSIIPETEGIIVNNNSNKDEAQNFNVKFDLLKDVAIKSQHGTFTITVKNVHSIDYDSHQSGMKLVTIQAEIENHDYANIWDNQISSYEICEVEGVSLLDSDRYDLAYYGIAGIYDDEYEVDAYIKTGSKKRVSLPFLVSESCEAVYVQIGDICSDLIYIK